MENITEKYEKEIESLYSYVGILKCESEFNKEVER